MKTIRLRNVVLTPKSLNSAIAEIERTIEKHRQMKEHLEAALSIGAGKGTIGRSRGGRGRRAKGEQTLREAILGVLGKTKRPVKPVDLRDKVLQSGYATAATPQSLYTAVFNTARKEPAIVKTKEGFQLRKGRGAAKTATRKKSGKKARRKAKAKR